MTAPKPSQFAPGESPRLLHRGTAGKSSPFKPQATPAQAEPIPAPKLRQQIVRLPVDALLDVLSGKLRVANIPSGATLVSSWYDSTFDGMKEVSRVLCLRIEHSTLPEHESGTHLARAAAILEKRK